MSKVEIKGEIASQAFTQTIILHEGEQRIDCNLTINWKKNIGIGSGYKQKGGLEAKDVWKPFYNDSLKLLALFPVSFQTGKIYKDAPFDVTESKLNNTFFTTWDSIKNNIILNWVDLYDAKNNVGLALFTDHTTTYTYGPDFPLGLNVQYSGSGLWGRSHAITGPTSINYAILPHSGKWDEDAIATASVNWNEPLIAFFSTKAVGPEKSLVNVSGTGLQVTTTYMEGEDLMIRLFNAEGDDTVKKIYVGVKADQIQLIELDGKVRSDLKIQKEENQYYISLAIPRFGIRTLRVVHCKPIK
jgi:alpha-mannosidase